MDPAHEPFELGDWRVDATGNRLLRGTEVRPLRHKAMALLVLLARRPGETVTRDEIVSAVWDGNRFVAPKAINTAVWAIRQALGDDPESPRYLQTIAKKGYRLIAPVRAVTPAADTLPARPAPTDTPLPGPPAAAAPRVFRTALVGALLLLVALGAWQVAQRAMPAPAVAALPAATPLTHNPGLEYLGQVSPDGRLLAFAWWQGQGVGQLYLRAAADLAATPTLVSSGLGEVQGLAWSPDGQALVFTAASAQGHCTLWLYRLRDQARRELARCQALFTPTVDWSPDGRWIVFSAEADGAGGLFLVAPDGSGLRRLTTAPPAAMGDHQPAWSPDGRRLAFVRQDPSDGTRDLYETRLDGPVQRLSAMRLYLLHGLTYAANGQDLVFSTTRQDTRVLLRWDRAAATAVPLGLEGSAPARRADGRLVYALMRSHVSIARVAWGRGAPQRLITSVASERSPDVDSAGNRTVFISRRSGRPELWQAGARGQQASALTQLDGQVSSPAWSPRGDQVAFLGNCGPGKRFGLCVLDAPRDPTQRPAAPRPLAADAASYGRPAWHPTAAEVWVSSDRGGRWQLWRFAADGSGTGEAVATEAPPGRALQWAADGSALLYQPVFSSRLRWRPAGGGAERSIQVAGDDETLVDWRLGPAGAVALLRGTGERFVRVDLAGGRRQVLSEHALGTFPELATFTLGPDGTALVDIADTAVADLMQAR
jgi:Tol biopolymer transport system component/DNA-binding winged helix-turn-helix (wHTH) protein